MWVKGVCHDNDNDDADTRGTLYNSLQMIRKRKEYKIRK